MRYLSWFLYIKIPKVVLIKNNVLTNDFFWFVINYINQKYFPTKMTTFPSFPMSNIRFMIAVTIKEITNMKTNHFLRLKLFWFIDKHKETEIKVWDYDLFYWVHIIVIRIDNTFCEKFYINVCSNMIWYMIITKNINER